MSRPDWHYGDVLVHPLMSELRVMFVTWLPAGEIEYMAGLVLTDDSMSTHTWTPGYVHTSLLWGGTVFPAKMIERLER